MTLGGSKAKESLMKMGRIHDSSHSNSQATNYGLSAVQEMDPGVARVVRKLQAIQNQGYSADQFPALPLHHNGYLDGNNNGYYQPSLGSYGMPNFYSPNGSAIDPESLEKAAKINRHGTGK
jgi:hypothetical protein